MNAGAEVSIVIPIKGRPELFAETARSLVGQSLPNWEAIVVDDGSQAGDLSRIAGIAAADSRFRLMANPGRRGASACRNAGLRAGTGGLVIFLDSDDALAPTCLQRRTAVMAADPRLDFAVFPTLRFNQVPGDSDLPWYPLTPEDDLDRFLAGPSPWQTTGPVWRRASLARVGPWDEQALSWQDWEFHVRALSLGLRYTKMEGPDSYWRTPSPASISRMAHSRRYIANRVRLYFRIVALLRSRGALTVRRRRILARHFFGYAFRSGQPRKRALQFWSLGRRSGVVSALDFIFMLACEPVVRNRERLGRVFENALYPDGP